MLALGGPRRAYLFVEIVQVLAGPEGICIIDLKAAAAHVERHRVCGVGLQLDGMDASSCCLSSRRSQRGDGLPRLGGRRF